MQKTLPNPVFDSLLPAIDLALTGGVLTPHPRKWITIWLQHIAFYSSAPVTDLTQLLEGLQSPAFGFYAPNKEAPRTRLTPVGLYIPSNLTHNTIQLGPEREIPANLLRVSDPLLLLQSNNTHHWVDLRAQNHGEDFCLPYTVTVNPESATLPFPPGLVKHLPFADKFLETPHIPPELEKCFWYQPPEIILNSQWLTDALASPTLQQLLAPAELDQLKTRQLQLKCHHVHKRLKYQLTLSPDRNGKVAHILKGSLPWAEVQGQTLPSLIAELLGSYVQTGLLHNACTAVGFPIQERKSLEMVQTPHFTVYWRWNTRGVISIVEPSSGLTDAIELFTDPANKAAAVVAPVNETPEAALKRIQSLLTQLQTFLTNHQCASLTC